MGRNREDDITPLQQETLDEICRYVSAKGYPPTIKELSDKFGISHDKPPHSGLTTKSAARKENRNGCNETWKSITVCRLW